MSRDAAPSAVPLANSPVVGAETPMATAAMHTGIAHHARCIPRPAPVLAMRPRYPASHAMTVPFMAVIAASRSAPPVDARIRTAIAAIPGAVAAVVGAMIAIPAGKLQ